MLPRRQCFRKVLLRDPEVEAGCGPGDGSSLCGLELRLLGVAVLYAFLEGGFVLAQFLQVFLYLVDLVMNNHRIGNINMRINMIIEHIHMVVLTSLYMYKSITDIYIGPHMNDDSPKFRLPRFSFSSLLFGMSSGSSSQPCLWMVSSASYHSSHWCEIVLIEVLS